MSHRIKMDPFPQCIGLIDPELIEVSLLLIV